MRHPESGSPQNQPPRGHRPKLYGRLLLVALLLFPPPLWAATITVDETAALPCTLVDAVIAANTDGPSGSCPAG